MHNDSSTGEPTIIEQQSTIINDPILVETELS